jgi:hypothetical protein
MCRNIKMLFNFSPPVTEEEVRAAPRCSSCARSPASTSHRKNEAAFLAAVDGSRQSRAIYCVLETAPRREIGKKSGEGTKRARPLLAMTDGHLRPNEVADEGRANAPRSHASGAPTDGAHPDGDVSAE